MSRLLAQIVSLTPSNYESFTRCPRLFFNESLLGIPASDAGRSSDQGLLVHDMLYTIHQGGSCADTDHVADVLAGHDADSEAIREMVARHSQRCPARASDSNAHEQELARFHRVPPPMFMASARIDAIWVHDGILDARDYKTGSLWHTCVADVPAAKVQAYVLASAATKRGLRLRLRYEYLQPEVADDPEPWEPDDDDIALVEEELRDAVERMWADERWTGIGEADVCGTCRYRSICRDSVTPGEPTWPVLSLAP